MQTGRPADRVQRLKDAKVDAARDIESLRVQRLAELAEHEKQVGARARPRMPMRAASQFSGSLQALRAAQEADALDQTARSDACFAQHRDAVVAALLRAVADVRPALHENAGTRGG